VWEDTGLLVRDEDVFRSGRSRYRIAEPLITFYEVVGRPQWGRLEAGHAEIVWADARARFSAQVLGPHFETLCRRWAQLVGADVFGALPGEVGAGVVADPANRTQIEVDVAVFAPVERDAPRRVLSLGEAKWGKTMTLAHVDRLRRAAHLLEGRGYDTSTTKLTCYGGAGFDEQIIAAAARDGRIHLVEPADLYAPGAASVGG
jgi:hypothetical protein